MDNTARQDHSWHSCTQQHNSWRAWSNWVSSLWQDWHTDKEWDGLSKASAGNSIIWSRKYGWGRPCAAWANSFTGSSTNFHCVCKLTTPWLPWNSVKRWQYITNLLINRDGTHQWNLTNLDLWSENTSIFKTLTCMVVPNVAFAC